MYKCIIMYNYAIIRGDRGYAAASLWRRHAPSCGFAIGPRQYLWLKYCASPHIYKVHFFHIWMIPYNVQNFVRMQFICH